MWSVPFSQDLHTNWLGVYIGEQHIRFSDFYYNFDKLKQDFQIQMREFYGGYIHHLQVDDINNQFRIKSRPLLSF